MRGGIKTLKHNVWTTLRLDYHGCKNLTHTSKTRQLKRTQVVATGRFTIRAFVTFQTVKNRTQVATRRSRKSMWDLNQNRRQKVFTIRDFAFAQRKLTFWKLDKISTDYSVSYFNLEGLSEPTTAPRGDGNVLIVPYAANIEKRTKRYNHRIK